MNRGLAGSDYIEVSRSRCMAVVSVLNAGMAAVGAAVQRGGVVVRPSDSQSIEPGFQPTCGRFKAWAISFTPRCSSSHSCTNEYLAVDSSGYM